MTRRFAGKPPRLVFMMKAPVAGAVKTRLAADIGGDSATALYRRFVEFLCSRLFADPNSPWMTTIAYAPADRGEQVQAWLAPLVHKGVVFRPQHDGDLGDRLEAEFSAAFAEGAPAVLALGTDCLDLDAEEIAACFRDLQCRDVVLGEATDGGYWCIGLSGPHGDLFRGMPWSQPELAEATRKKAGELGLTIADRARRMDIDRRADLLRLPAEMVKAAGLNASLWLTSPDAPEDGIQV